jgi:hypothetical protein
VAATKAKASPQAPGPDDPVVLLDIERERGCLYLVLANDGVAPAFDVRVTFERPLLGAGGEVDVAELAIFRKLPLLRAGREYRVFLDVAEALLARRGAKQVRAEVTYRTRARRRLGEVFTHDLRIWKDLPEVQVGEQDHEPAPRRSSTPARARTSR